MAGHFLIAEINDNRKLDKLYAGVVHDLKRNSVGLRGSLKYKQLPDEYLEEGDTGVFMKYCNVPESIVVGGKAALEVHTNGKTLNKIYMVA